MSPPADLNHLLDKIRASGCLTPDELQSQAAMVHGWQTLLRADQWDRWWEAELEQHVCRAGRLGRRHLPTTSDAVVFGLLGGLAASYGIFILAQRRQGIGGPPEAWLAGGLLAAACLLFFLTVRTIQKRRRYQPQLQAYEAGRGAELRTLAARHRPGARICPRCLKYTS